MVAQRLITMKPAFNVGILTLPPTPALTTYTNALVKSSEQQLQQLQ